MEFKVTRTYYDNDLVNCERFYDKEGKLMRVCKYFRNGVLESEVFVNKNGNFHNPTDDCPAITKYFNSKIKRVSVIKFLNNGSIHRDGDRPAIIYFDMNGNVQSEDYFINNKLHRDNDKPALINYYSYSNKIKSEEYYIDGQRNRVNIEDPIQVFYNENGVVIKKYFKNTKNNISYIQYFDNGLPHIIEYKNEENQYHRDENKPALQVFFESGKCSTEQYYVSGILHRDEDKPANIRYYSNENCAINEYYVSGTLHRNGDKPAIIIYYETTGTIYSEEYYTLGKRHRDGNKPAVIKYFTNGNIKSECFYIDGKIPFKCDEPSLIEFLNDKDEDVVYIYYDENENEIRREMFNIQDMHSKACR